MFEVNVFSQLALIQALLPYMSRRSSTSSASAASPNNSSSAIVFMSSGIVEHPAEAVSSYGASKIALEYIMKCFASELQTHNSLPEVESLETTQNPSEIESLETSRMPVLTCAIHPGIVQQTEMFQDYLSQGKRHFSTDHLAWLLTTLEEKAAGTSKEALLLAPDLEQVAQKLANLVKTGLSMDHHGKVLVWHDLP